MLRKSIKPCKGNTSNQLLFSLLLLSFWFSVFSYFVLQDRPNRIIIRNAANRLVQFAFGITFALAHGWLDPSVKFCDLNVTLENNV